MGQTLTRICSSAKVVEDEQKTIMEGYYIKRNERNFIVNMLESTENFSRFIDLSKFGFYFGISLKSQVELRKSWKNVNLGGMKVSFGNSGVNEVVCPKLKYLIRKGVPLDQTRLYILTIFALVDFNSDIEYTNALKSVESTLESDMKRCPTFSDKKIFSKVLKHHCLNVEGIKVCKS